MNTIASFHGDETGVAPGEASSSVAGDENVTAPSSMSTSSQSCQFVTAQMSESEISDAIENSREHGWSELRDKGGDVGTAIDSLQLNALIWAELREENPYFFIDFQEGELKLGRLIAEGGQAQVFECTWGDNNQFVAKVFKLEGFSLLDLKRQMPLPAERFSRPRFSKRRIFGGVEFGEAAPHCCKIWHGSLSADGRFVFVMRR